LKISTFPVYNFPDFTLRIDCVLTVGKPKEGSMWRKATLAMILVACLTATALAGDWWEEDQSAATSSTKQVASFQGPTSGSAAKTLVNWEDGYIEAVGMATVDMGRMKNLVQAELMAQEGACTMAYAKLSEMLNGVAVTAHTTVVTMLTEDQYARSATQGIIKGARRIEERVDRSGDAPKGICRIGIVMRGAKGLQVPAYEYAVRNKIEGKIPVFKPAEVPTAPVQNYTGIVIDARGYNLKPAMIPQIYTEDGKLLYGASVVDGQAARQNGLAGYASNMDCPCASKRVGNNPLVIKANGLYGKQNAGVKISTTDAIGALAANGAGNLLKLAKVLFLL
jgi:hypothetical protein